MDLFTAAKRLTEARPIDGRPLAIAEHGVIGDGFSCGLVGIDGSISWLCFPKFDSPAVFSSLLDSSNGGSCRVAPEGDGFVGLQSFDDATNVLQTLFRREGNGSLMVTDFMPWTDDRHSALHEVHRLLEVREGSLNVEVHFDPRFDFGRGETRVYPADHGVLAEGPNGERLTLSAPPEIRFEPDPRGGAVARFPLRSGQRVWVVLSWNSKRPEPIVAFRSFEQLRRTRRFWRNWAGQLRYDGPWRHDVLRSALTLKLLQYAPTGAVVAAPTTSLPAWLGGDRNWDYRFSWTRDSAMAIRAMNLIGYRQEALGFFHFVRDCVDRRGRLDLMLTIEGNDVPMEEELGHLSGHANSSPVRIGNGAAHQIQHDIIGPLLDAAFLYERSGGLTSLRLWREIRHLVDAAIRTIDEPDHGIWEPRMEPTHNVHSKLMTWAALDRALELAPLFGGDREEWRWYQARDRVREQILARGYNPELGAFVGSYASTHPDATLLLFPIYGFLPPDDPRVARTLDFVWKELGDGRYLRRYYVNDGIGSKEGGFLLCGFWLAEALALGGRLDEALQVFQDHVNASNHLGLLSEEIDPSSGALLGNFPQAFSHLGLIQAAARLDLALRLRDEGTEQPPRHAMELSVPGLVKSRES